MIEVLIDEGLKINVSHDVVKQVVEKSCFLAENIKNISVCIRFAADDEVQQLNAQWRNQDKVTDVLSFPMQEEGCLDASESLGDMILAIPFVRDEAKRLDVTEDAHIYHLIAHSTLHLLGYNHMLDADAKKMQCLENAIMAELGLHKPYPEWN